jgi:oligo-alginate lyase
VEFTLPGEFRIWHASTPDAPPDRREGFYLETLGAKAKFTTVISPAGHTPK